MFLWYKAMYYGDLGLYQTMNTSISKEIMAKFVSSLLLGIYDNI